MGYYYTTSPENAVSPKSWATPKTHTPGAPVKERGHRYFTPEIGRWASRDPIGDESFFLRHAAGKNPSAHVIFREQSLLPTYLFALNNSIMFSDPIGLDLEQVKDACKCVITGAAIKKCLDMKSACIACLEKWSDLGGLAGWQGKSWKKQEPEKKNCTKVCDAALKCYDDLGKACEAAKELPY
jgi:RHS repeat-associated protein